MRELEKILKRKITQGHKRQGKKRRRIKTKDRDGDRDTEPKEPTPSACTRKLLS